MKKKNKLEYRNTSEGKKLFKMYIVGHIFLGITLVGLLYVILNEGHIMTGLMSGAALASALFAICGTFLISLYVFSVQNYNNKKKK